MKQFLSYPLKVQTAMEQVENVSEKHSSSSGSTGPSQVKRLHFWRKERHTGQRAERVANEYEPIAYWKLFRYATRGEKLMTLLSLVVAAIHGSLYPLLVITFGDVIDDFGKTLLDPSNEDFVPTTEVSGTIETTTNLTLVLAFTSFVFSFIQLELALITANRIGNTLRTRFFESLISQDCDFFDESEAGTLTHMAVNDIDLIQAGIGDKLATAVQYSSTFIVGIVIAFIFGWKLALILLSVVPVMAITGIIFGNASSKATGKGLGAYGESGGIASEVISMIRTVTTFGGQEEEAKRYESSLEKAYKASIKAALSSGIGLGIAMFTIMGSYALAFWFGSRFVNNGEMSAGDVLLTFLSIAIGASSLGTAGPGFKSFSAARAAAPRLFEIIERPSPIDPLAADDGIIPGHAAEGHIKFENVDFNYRKRVVEDTDSPLVLNNFSLEIPKGSSEAFVGKSGCGKSTVVRLIMRLYDPKEGRILLDGLDLRELNVRWLRSQIGVVSQNPSLFMMSIKENIALGVGCETHVDPATGGRLLRRKTVSDEEVVRVCKLANAHSFISKLPDGYNTVLGQRGALLSGGQKQRICIARALIRDPKILLLDESTSSLDTASERLVQIALEKAAAGRTTITIAHRLSTVRNVNSIAYIENGRILERGNHQDLIQRAGGFYRGLFELQNIEGGHGDTNLQPTLETGIQRNLTVEESSAGPKSSQEQEKKLIPTDGADFPARHRLASSMSIFRRTIRINQAATMLLVLGMLGSVLEGSVFPLSAIPLVQVIGVMQQGNDTGDMRKWCLVFVFLGVVGFVGNALQHSALGVYGEKLSKLLRSFAFRSLLRQEIGYFDMKENSLGALTSRLSRDAGAVKGLTGDLLAVGLNVVTSILAGLIISFISCWQLAAVVLAIVPGIALGGYFEMKASSGIDSKVWDKFADAHATASEAVDNISTVRNFGLEDFFSARYNNIIARTVNARHRKHLVVSLSFGFSEFCKCMIWYATYKAGGSFVEQGYCSYEEMFRSTLALMFGAEALGSMAIFAPDVAASKLGAENVYGLIDRESEIDASGTDGEYLGKVKGEAAAADVYFEYPRRPDVPVLKGLSIQARKASKLAIVGTSGHGKSTILALLLRFYSVRKGLITVDDKDITLRRITELRSNLGYVAQDPELFNRSVFDNIAYGAPQEDGWPISLADVVNAAKQANAHEFIEKLPNGYDTLVGPRGEALSGGQRQRVAIARSLIRSPPILLLDEATSALDSRSEQLVQEALDAASFGRTTIIVAHRLSTIRNADLIAVIYKGRVVEEGTHDELLEKQGAYSRLIRHQLTEM